MVGLSPRLDPLDPLLCAQSHCHPSPATHPPQNYPKPQTSIFLHLHGSSPRSVLAAAVWGWHHSPTGEPPGKGKAFSTGVWGGRGDTGPHPVPQGLVGLPRVSPRISCAASPSARRPQRLWQPHLFTGWICIKTVHYFPDWQVSSVRAT